MRYTIIPNTNSTNEPGLYWVFDTFSKRYFGPGAAESMLDLAYKLEKQWFQCLANANWDERAAFDIENGLINAWLDETETAAENTSGSVPSR